MFKQHYCGILGLLLILSGILVFSGCGGSSTTESRTSSTPAAATSTSVNTPLTTQLPTSTSAATITSISAINTTSPSSVASSTTPTAATTSAGVSTTITPSATPKPTTTTTTEAPFPTTLYKPAATPYVPGGTQKDLFQYVLELINKDRADQRLAPVELAYNAAAQKHAQDMLDNNYLAHWGTDGLKPYMRYTFEGGLNYENENSAYSNGNKQIDARTEIKALEYAMVYDDAASNWSHRDNIWNKMHKKVSLGVAYNQYSLAMVQQFEGDYVEYYQPPKIQGNVLSLSGRLKTAGMTLNNVAITWDPLPQNMTAAQLNTPTYRSYGLGSAMGQVFAPPPPNAKYNNLPDGSIVASKGQVKDDVFWLEADISPILAKGPGVYNICLIVVTGGEANNFSNYSILIK
jgi:uncharacterized protein YkwD